MFSLSSKGDFKNFNRFVKHMSQQDYRSIIEKYARMGVIALAEATPKDSGETAASWDYDIHYSKKGTKIVWTNSNITKDGTPIAILLQYGHATKNGTFVQGIDYINPTMQLTFIHLAEELWKEVTSY